MIIGFKYRSGFLYIVLSYVLILNETHEYQLGDQGNFSKNTKRITVLFLYNWNVICRQSIYLSRLEVVVLNHISSRLLHAFIFSYYTCLMSTKTLRNCPPKNVPIPGPISAERYHNARYIGSCFGSTFSSR